MKNKVFIIFRVNRYVVVLLLLLTFLTPLLAVGQDYLCYDKISSSNGLSQSTVNCIFQDKDGLIWIGTQNGLNMYDGYHFVHYLNQPSDTTSLSDNYIRSICEDNSGNLWIGTMSGGLNKLNKHTGRFTVYSYSKNDTTGISNNTVWKVAIDSLNNIWAVTKKGINVLNTETNLFKHYRYSEADNSTIPSDMTISIFVDKQGEVWCGTLSGLAKYNLPDDSFYRYDTFQSEQNSKNFIIWAITQNSFGNMLFGTNQGLWEQDAIDKNNFKCINNNDEISSIWSLLPVNNNIWAGTNTGLWVFNYEDKTCLNVPDIFSTREQHDGNIWFIIKDNAGIIWTGNDNGILKFRPQKGRFRSITIDPSKSPHLSQKSVNSILVDRDKTLWIGTDGGGLNVLREGADDFELFLKNDFQENTISGNKIWALMQDSDGLIWIGTYGAGLNSFNKETGKFTNYKVNKSDPNALSNNRVLALLEDNDGKIWVGTRGGGLNMFDKETGKFMTFRHKPDNTASISSNTVLSLAEDQQGNIVVGTFEGGLSIYDKRENTFHNFKNDPSNPNSLSNNNVWVVMFDSNNRLWLGTQGGLNFADYSGQELRFHHFESASGLPSNIIFGLEEDVQGNIWISTFNRMAKLNNNVFKELVNRNVKFSTYKNDPFNPLFKTFDESNGLAGNEFNQGAYYKSGDGMIYFGGMVGLTCFHPDSVQINEFEPNVILSGFKIFNKEVGILPQNVKNKSTTGQIINLNGEYFIPKKITFLDKLALTYRESVFSFEFASLDYTMPGKNRYAYKMENFDQEWNYVTGQNSATYTNLDVGNYVFIVKGTNSDGKWSQKEARLNITIIPPYWKTRWFITLMILSLLAIIIFIILRIIYVQKRNALAEREKIELQLKTIKNQIDPHFAFNAMNMIGSLVYKGNPDTVYDYFTRFANLIRTTLNDSEKIARSLQEELEFVRNYIEMQQTRFKGKFDFILNIDKETDLSTEVPKMIIQTHTENAIKHGLMHKKGKGRLTIDISEKDNVLTVSVEDDGIGREKAAQVGKGSTGKGMQIINQIFILYNKLFDYKINQQIIDLKDKNGKPAGTRVNITINKG